jgi:tripartite-type tricarboxylate transporter receptor subunit TctC
MMGLYGPAAMPAAVVARLEAAARAVVARPEAQARLRELGCDPVGSSASELAQYWDQQLALWLPLVRESGATVD